MLGTLGAVLILLSGNAFAASVSTSYATQTALNTEIAARKAADTTEATARNTAIGTAIATEVSNRNTAIATERTRAIGVEGTLNAADTAEVTNRNAAIGSAIGTEVTSRNAAIAVEAAARDAAIVTAIGGEATARDAAIATAVNASGSSFSYSMTCGVSGTDACKIGAVGPGGGWIFFVDYNDEYPFNYLEAAPTDISAVAWCNNTNTSISAVAGWSANAVGRGKANTTAMSGVCTSGAANSALAYFTLTTQAGDWFLGSSGEMLLMSTNLRQAGVGGFAYEHYSSSTEFDANMAFQMAFLSGTSSLFFSKSDALLVRAVRSFN